MNTKERLAASEAAHYALMLFEDDSVNGRIPQEETDLILQALDNVSTVLCRAREQAELEEQQELILVKCSAHGH